MVLLPIPAPPLDVGLLAHRDALGKVGRATKVLEGTHRMEGVFAAAGDHIRPSTSVKANMADIAQTLLASLGLPIPSDMEGRVLTDIFTNPPTVQTEDVHDNAGQGDDQPDESQVYNEREQAILTERLADLGYLE